MYPCLQAFQLFMCCPNFSAVQTFFLPSLRWELYMAVTKFISSLLRSCRVNLVAYCKGNSFGKPRPNIFEMEFNSQGLSRMVQIHSTPPTQRCNSLKLLFDAISSTAAQYCWEDVVSYWYSFWKNQVSVPSELECIFLVAYTVSSNGIGVYI